MVKTRKRLTDLEIITLFKDQKKSGYEFRERRQPDWNENYSLYRDRVTTNRLTQRQSVNVPLMKGAINTNMKDMTGMPQLEFDNLDNDEVGEVFYNEYYKEVAEQGRFTVKDLIDKKQGLLYGRTFKKLHIIEGQFDFEVVDPQDMLIDRFVDPANIDSARYLIQTNIYRTITELESNDDFDQSEVARMRTYFEGGKGVLESDDNFMAASDRAKRLADMGLNDAMAPIVGETYIELNEVYIRLWSERLEREVFHVLVVATTGSGDFLLSSDELCEVLGQTRDNYWYNHLPYVSWGGDLELTDFWSDGSADIYRTPNKILNVWWSQYVENRTLRSFGMNYYDATNKKFQPSTFVPEAGGWYGLPGKPSEVFQRVDIPELTGTTDDMTFMIALAEKAGAATAAQQGDVEKRDVTLGEIKIALSEAKERVGILSVFYNESWKEFGTKYIKLLEGSADLISPIEITRKGRLGKLNYTRTVDPKEWFARSGYKVQVKFESDKQKEDIEQIEKLNAARAIMPANVPLDSIYKRKIVEFAGLNPDEVAQVMEFEEQSMAAMQNTSVQGLNPAAGQDPNAMQPIQSQPVNANVPAMANVVQ